MKKIDNLYKKNKIFNKIILKNMNLKVKMIINY